MIEVQIKNEEIYEKLKKSSSYHSDITKVCSFRDEMRDLLDNYHLDYIRSGTTLDKPLLTIVSRKVMKLEGATPEMLHYVGVRSEYDPTIPLRYMGEVHQLIQQNLVECTEKFKEVYSPMSYRNKINDLICANVKFYNRGKLTDFVDGNLTIQSLNIPKCKEKTIFYKQMYLSVLSPQMMVGKTSEIKCVNDNGEPILLKFYIKNELLKSIAFEGNKISILTTKVTESYNSLMVTDPIIVPKGLELPEEIMYSPPSRAIPADLYRNALYEFLYRYNA